MFVFIISSDKEYENLPYPFSKSIWFILWYVLLLQMIHYLPQGLIICNFSFEWGFIVTGGFICNLWLIYASSIQDFEQNIMNNE